MKKGWEVKRLGDVCELYQPKTISTKEMVDDGPYPVFGANGIIGKFDQYNHEEPQLLITCRGATCGSVNISLPKSWINGNAMVVRPKNNSLEIRFVEYLFRGGIDISKTITGAAQPQITRQTLAPIQISFPKSLAEQQRIVAILDEAFAAIAKAKGNAEQNLKNAKELFESYLQGVFEQRGEGWKETRLGEILIEMMTGPFGSMLHKSDYVHDGVAVVNPQNIIGGEIVPLEKTMVSLETQKRLSKYALREKDIVMARRGEMGRCAIVKKENVGWLCGTGSLVIRANGKFVDEQFLNLYLSSSKAKEYLEKSSIGATMNNLNQGILHELPIAIPNVQKQKQLISNFEAIGAETKRLEAIYQQKIVALDELKKTLLQKAFRGELDTERVVRV